MSSNEETFECLTKGDLRIIHADGHVEVIPKHQADLLATAVVVPVVDLLEDEGFDDELLWAPVSRGVLEEDLDE